MEVSGWLRYIGTKWRKNIAENFHRLSRVQKRTDVRNARMRVNREVGFYRATVWGTWG